MANNNAAQQQDAQPLPLAPKTSPITNESAQQTFKELSSVYRDYQNQISKAQKVIKTLTGDSECPGTIWKLVEVYGYNLNPRDRQEHVLRVDGQVWSIRRTNSRFVWDFDAAIEVFKLAYTIQTAEDGSDKQRIAFDSFQCLLEKLSDAEVTLSAEDWWQMIDDAADLYRTTVERTIRLGALESIANEIPELLLKALCKPQAPQYGLHVQSGNDSPPPLTSACGACHNVIDDEDFYCKYCGNALGKE